MLKLLGKKSQDIFTAFKTHPLFTNYKGGNVQWRDLAPPQLSGQIPIKGIQISNTNLRRMISQESYYY